MLRHLIGGGGGGNDVSEKTPNPASRRMMVATTAPPPQPLRPERRYVEPYRGAGVAAGERQLAEEKPNALSENGKPQRQGSEVEEEISHSGMESTKTATIMRRSADGSTSQAGRPLLSVPHAP